MKLPWFIPQERLVPETEDEINQAYKNLSKGNQQIIEYRDEAKRSWWNFLMSMNIGKISQDGVGLVKGPHLKKGSYWQNLM